MESTDKKPAAFLDRDGTIIVDKNYLGDPDGVELISGSAEAIRKLNEAGYLCIVVSNQSGVARGFYDEAAVEAVNDRMRQLLSEQGAQLDEIYYCPHHPQAARAEYCKECEGRKPNVGMVTQAMEKFKIDLHHSFAVGDHHSDVKFAENLGIISVLVTTGHGRWERERIEDEQLSMPDYVAQNLLEAVEWIFQPVAK